jgi:hypothetical protein
MPSSKVQLFSAQILSVARVGLGRRAALVALRLTLRARGPTIASTPLAMKTLARPRDKAEILGRLTTVRPDGRRRWGRMSAHQMVCHLADAFRMAIGERTVSPAEGLLQRTVVKWVALYAPVPWPAGIPTRPGTDQETGGTRPVEFSADLARAEALLELFTAPDRDLHRTPHPIFGGMSGAAWLRWGYLHTDHHLRQFGR